MSWGESPSSQLNSFTAGHYSVPHIASSVASSESDRPTEARFHASNRSPLFIGGDATRKGAAPVMLSPHYRDGFWQSVGLLAEHLGVRPDAQVQGQDNRDAFVKPTSQINTRNVRSIEGSYFFCRLCWEGEKATAVDLAQHDKREELATLYEELDYAYCFPGGEWDAFEHRENVLQRLVNLRFLSTDIRSVPLKLCLQRTKERELVLLQPKWESWSRWGMDHEEDAATAYVDGRNLYGRALMKARTALMSVKWQEWMKKEKEELTKAKEDGGRTW